jgi:hypothetical protein
LRDLLEKKRISHILNKKNFGARANSVLVFLLIKRADKILALNFLGGNQMDNILKFCEQLALLNQLKNKKLVTKYEYDKIKEYIKKKYNIGVYAMEL